jgi:membrane-bound lytic murein transglycosylase MltF
VGRAHAATRGVHAPVQHGFDRDRRGGTDARPGARQGTAATTGIPPAKVSKTWTGDFDGMVKRRVIRVLVPYSKTFYFVDRAVQRGLSYEVTQLLEADLNKKLKTGNIKVHVVCIPVTRGEMIPALLEGRGDIATGNPTITPSA